MISIRYADIFKRWTIKLSMGALKAAKDVYSS